MVSGGVVVIIKSVVVITRAMKDDVDVVSHGRYSNLVRRIIIRVTDLVVVTFSIVVQVAVDVEVCVASVTKIYASLAVDNAVAIPDAVPFVITGAIVSPVSNNTFDAGIAGIAVKIFGGSCLTMDMIGTVSTSDGNYFDDNCLQGVGVLAYCVDESLIVTIIFFADLCKCIIKEQYCDVQWMPGMLFGQETV